MSHQNIFQIEVRPNRKGKKKVAKVGRPVGSLTDRTKSGPEMKLAAQFELAKRGQKGSLKFHEVRSAD